MVAGVFTRDRPTGVTRLVGVTTISAKLVSEATRKQLDLEVAMVLDNSGSMASNSRMTNLKKAARCATDILFNAITDCSDAALTTADPLTPTVANVKIGISPFNEFVNVGTGYKTASWMDQTGATRVAKDGFDNDDSDANTFNTNVNRFDLFTAINVPWKGCVEARNHTTGAGGLYSVGRAFGTCGSPLVWRAVTRRTIVNTAGASPLRTVVLTP